MAKSKPVRLPQWTLPYFLSVFGLALFWSLENFFIQAAAFDAQPTTLHPYIYEACRLGLDLLAAGAVVLLFNRHWLLSLIAVDFALSAMTLPYGHYFHHALSIKTALATLSEGARVSGVGIQVLEPAVWLGLVTALVLKLYWVFKITPQPAAWRRSCGAALVLAWGVCILALQYTTFALPSLRNRSVSRSVYAYGYLNAWAAEFCFGPDMNEMGRKLRELQKVSPNRLVGVEKPWPVSGNVVAIQMESIGWEVLHSRIAGTEVTPYLNSLAESGRCFRVQAYHTLASEDMDFAVLSDGTPLGQMLSYDFQGVDYSAALPAFMRAHGFHTVAWHGNDGGFFNRRPNFERMGFDEIWFKEELCARPVKTSSWGVRDEEIFQRSRQEIQCATVPQFHFIITLDTHAPFTLIDEEEKQIFPGSTSWAENYFNSVRALDNELREYVESLPSGTLVILYGDHPAGVNYQDFHPARNGGAEFVPCIVHLCGCAAPFPSNASLTSPLPDDLRILDVVNFLRAQVPGAQAMKPPAPAQAGIGTAETTGRAFQN